MADTCFGQCTGLCSEPDLLPDLLWAPWVGTLGATMDDLDLDILNPCT